MQISFTFRHLDPSEHLKSFIGDKLSRIEKYLDAAAEANVVLSVEKFRHQADITVAYNGLRIKGFEETEDMYSAVDLVIDKLEKQVRRRQDKRRSRKSQTGQDLKSLNYQMTLVSSAPVDDGEEPTVIESKRVQAKPMDVDEAIMQLDLSTDSFLVFTNARSQAINVLYRRKDGHFGIIEPD